MDYSRYGATKSAANPYGYNILRNWEWRKIRPEELLNSRFGYADITDHVVAHVTESYANPSLAESRILQRYDSYIGVIYAVDYLYNGIIDLFELLIDKHNFSEGGNIQFDDSDEFRILTSVNTLFSSLLVQSRRTIEKMEDWIAALFGEESSEYITWKDLTTEYFSISFEYALCSRLRNVVEHEFFLLSLVGVDKSNGVGTLVLNFEHEVLDWKNLGPAKQRIYDYVNSRLAEGKLARINAWDLIHDYIGIIGQLYLWFKMIVYRHATQLCEKVNDIMNSGGGRRNCLIRPVKRFGKAENDILMICSPSEAQEMYLKTCEEVAIQHKRYDLETIE